MSAERILLITSEEVAWRVAMPPIGTLSLGSAPSNTVALECLDPEQLIFFAEEELAVEVLASPVEIADAGSTKFRPAPTGQLIELEAGAKVRCGALEIEVIELVSLAPRARLLDRRSFDALVSARMTEDRRGALVVARFKVSGPATAEAVAAQLEASFRPGDLLSARGGGQYAAVLAETTVAEAAGLLTGLAKALEQESSTLSFGLAQAGEGDPDRLLALAAERMVSARASGEPSTRFVAVDPAMKAVMAQVDHAAGASTHVLMMGETGTGKDLIARLIHERSRRASGPLVRLSCVTLSESFDPAAISAQIGRARGGTVTLDELSALSPRAQRGLGHLLDEAQASGLDVRIIAFAGPEVAAAVQSGAFRKDLYYRLNQLEITLPPLRERRADIVPLAEQLLSEASEGPQRQSLSSAVRAKLEAYDWPGNVRELKNAMERALLHARGSAILVEHLPGAIRGPSEPSVVLSDDRPLRGLRDELAALEKRRILEALEKYPTQKEAAEALEMPMRTFLNRLDALGIQRARGGGRPRDETEEHE